MKKEEAKLDGGDQSMFFLSSVLLKTLLFESLLWLSSWLLSYTEYYLILDNTIAGSKKSEEALRALLL